MTGVGKTEVVPEPGASYTLDDLRRTGLLWLINRTVLHPRGFALALVSETPDGPATRWFIDGDGTQPWTFEDTPVEHQRFAAVEALLNAERPTA